MVGLVRMVSRVIVHLMVSSEGHGGGEDGWSNLSRWAGQMVIEVIYMVKDFGWDCYDYSP